MSRNYTTERGQRMRWSKGGRTLKNCPVGSASAATSPAAQEDKVLVINDFAYARCNYWLSYQIVCESKRMQTV
jgi:hypothetical protein